LPCLALPLPLPGLATTDDLQPEQNKIQTKEKKQTEAGNMKLKKQEKPKPKAKPKKKNYQMGITSFHSKQQRPQKEETRSNSSSWQQESKR